MILDKIYLYLEARGTLPKTVSDLDKIVVPQRQLRLSDGPTVDTLVGVPVLNSLPGAPANLFLDFNGDFEASFPLSIHSHPGNRRVSGQVNGGQFELQITTVNGDVDVQHVPAPPHAPPPPPALPNPQIPQPVVPPAPPTS